MIAELRKGVSPLPANLYMNRMLKGWKQTKRGEQFQARIVSYADDFVILSRGKAAEALGWARATLTRMGLTLNERNTSIRNARKERFDFLVIPSGLTSAGGRGGSIWAVVRRRRA